MSTPSPFNALKSLAKLQASSKTAALKQATEGPGTEPKTTPASEGARSKENERDMKEIVPVNGVGTVENKERDGTGLQTPDLANNGLNPVAAGEDVPGTQSQQKDPGTAHPAKAGGEGSEKSASTRDLISQGNKFLAVAAVGFEKCASIVKASEEDSKEDEKGEKGNSKGAEGEGKRLNPGVATGEKNDATLGQDGKKVSVEAGEAKTAGFNAGKEAADAVKKAAAAEDAQVIAYFQKEAAVAAEAMARQAVTDAYDMAEYMHGYKQAEEAPGQIDPQALMQLLQSVPPEQLPELIQKLQAQGVEIPPEILQALGLDGGAAGGAAAGGAGGPPPGAAAGAPPGAGAGAPPAEAGGGAGEPAGGAGSEEEAAQKAAAFKLGKQAAQNELRDILLAALVKQATMAPSATVAAGKQLLGDAGTDIAQAGKTMGGNAQDLGEGLLHDAKASPGMTAGGAAAGAGVGGLLAHLLSNGDHKTRNTIIAALGGGALGAAGGALAGGGGAMPQGLDGSTPVA